MALTNKDIARKLGISETALSFIINNKAGVGEKTRARAIKKITALGYAHILKKGKQSLTKGICFVIHKRHGGILNQSPFYMLFMEQIEEYVRNKGFNLIVRLIDTNDSPERHIRDLNASGISGVIVFATEMLDEDMEHFQQAEMPLVSMDNDFTHLGLDSVVINNRVGTYQAIRHLVANGHKRIGYLQCKTFINSFGERERGYRRALDQCGLELSPRHVFRVGYTEEENYQDFKRLLASGIDLPTALVSDDDTLSVGVLRALIEHGVPVPGRVSLVGFNDRPVCKITVPQLTTIAIPKARFGQLAVDLLVERIGHRKVDAADYRRVAAGVELVVRESTCQANEKTAAKPRKTGHSRTGSQARAADRGDG
ncbi:MAG: LacI family transcriptional regulator [Planctomycetaceae bacterium]|nr:LacI family transcriptional regulator [Planctomycetaceae bacterium]